MTECLGIYFENNIIKYAKLGLNSSKNVELKEYGIRFAKSNMDNIILDIIEETNSKNIPVVLNSTGDIYNNFQIIDNSSKRSYIKEILNTEFEAWCEKNAKSPEKFEYRYIVSNIKEGTKKCSGVLDIVSKNSLSDSLKSSYKISGIYPTNILLNNMVNTNNQSYILLNINKDIIATVVKNGEVIEIKNLGLGIEVILEKFNEKFGSYQKAYEVCRKINVYTDEENNDKELENIVEPILQDVIKRISTFVTRYKADIEKIYLTGNVNLFNNLDLLLKEYFDLKCEVLVPKVVKKDEKNITEIVEVTQAISIAYEYLIGDKSKNYLFKKNMNLFPKFEYKDINNRNVDVLKIALGVMIVAFVIYVGFGIIYSNRVNKIVASASDNLMEIDENISKINEDIKYISENKEKYKSINEQVEDITTSLSSDNNSSGVYNVATFLQNIIRIIPTNVKLNSISSDDNKNVKIIVESDSYSNLGYFISEIKLDGTLKNVTINDIKNGDITTVEIGGELP